MVDRVEFSPLGGIDPRQLFAQREARQALVGSLATEAPRISAPGPRPEPEAPQPAARQERSAQEEGEAQRAAREEAFRQNAGPRPAAPQEPDPALGPNQNAGESLVPNPVDLALEARLGPDTSQVLVAGTDQARAAGAPLFGGFGPAGPAPVIREIAPLGGSEAPDLPAPRPLGGAQPGGAPAALGPTGPEVPGSGRSDAAPAPQGLGAPQGSEPRGAVVDVLV